MNPAHEIKPGYLGLKELTRYLGVSETTIREWIRTQGLPCFQPRWALLFRIREVDAWMDQYRNRRARARRKKPSTGGAIGA